MARLTTSDSLLLPYPYSEDELCDYTFKIIVIGDVSVGKTCVLQRFRYGTYSEKHVSTIGVDFMSKTIKVDGKTIQLHIWDTAGQERYRTVTQSYYRNSHGVMMAFDITRERTFINLQMWLQDIKKFCGDVPILLIGTKLDLVTQNQQIREVDESSGQTFADTNDNVLAYIEVSARQGINVEKAFLHLTRGIKEKMEKANMCDCESYSATMDTVTTDLNARRTSCC